LAVCPVGLTPLQVAAFRPDPTLGNIYQVESSGYAKSQMFFVQFRTTLGKRINFNAGYTFGTASGDTDSLTSPRFAVNTVGYPAYSYDTSTEFGPSAFLPKHSFNFLGSFQLPWGIRANSIILASTGRRFNITSGVDNNYDSLFFERPTFAALDARCQTSHLTNSFCDMTGIDPNAVIPRNYGKGPGSFVVNLNLNKTIGFGGSSPKTAVADNGSGGSGRGGRGNRGGGGGGGGQRGGGGGGGGPMMMTGGGGAGGNDTRKPYSLSFGVSIQNLFNNVNFSNPVSSLNSPSFGLYRSTGGGFGFFGGGCGSANRCINLSTRFTF
jgi:hypothetical protein